MNIMRWAMRLVMAKVAGRAINKGIDMVARKAAKNDPVAQAKLAKNGRSAVKRARQAARITRRLGR